MVGCGDSGLYHTHHKHHIVRLIHYTHSIPVCIYTDTVCIVMLVLGLCRTEYINLLHHLTKIRVTS